MSNLGTTASAGRFGPLPALGLVVLSSFGIAGGQPASSAKPQPTEPVAVKRPVIRLPAEAQRIFPSRNRNPSAADIQAVEAVLRAPDNSAKRVAALERRISRNTAYLAKLGEQLQKAQDEGGEAKRRQGVSQFAYMVFVIESRIRADQVKLKKSQMLAQMRKRPPPADYRAFAAELSRSYAADERKAAREIVARAQAFQSRISEPGLRAQFDQEVGRIKESLEASEGPR